jgi:LAO/AO transport system kinase
VIKKGIMEVADVIAVNKADGPTANAAMMTVANITGTLGLIRHPRTSWFPKVSHPPAASRCCIRSGLGG